jgi:predicted Zn-dependent peptidase
VYQKTALNNGLRIVTSHMPYVRSVSVCIFIGAGSRYESPEKAGISHFVEHLLFKGTQRRPDPKDISEAIDGVGGVLNGGTDKEMTIYWAKVARPHLGLAFDVLGDMIGCSKFDPVEVEKERQVIIEEINMSMDSPQQRVGMLIDEAIWPEQTLGRDVAGSKETVSALTRKMLCDYHTCQYTPGTMVVSIAGDINHDEVVESTVRTFGGWREGTPASWFPVQDNQDEPRYVGECRETEMINFCLALRGFSNSHPARFALDLLNIVLGGGMSSRLFVELRERKGLVYDVHSYVNHFFDSGSVIVYAGVEPKNVEAAISIILDELSSLKVKDVPEAELVKAKEMAKGRLLLSMEDTRSVAGWIGSQELLKGEIKTTDEMVSIVDAITSDELRKVAQDLFHPRGLSLAIVGPTADEGRLRRLLVL